MGKSSPTASLTFFITSTPNLALFSNEPPYMSFLKFVKGDRNCDIKYPAEPSISTESNPDIFALYAAFAKSSSIVLISSILNSLGVSFVSFDATGEGATGCFPMKKDEAYRPA